MRRWLLAGAFMAPVGVLLHELGHYCAYVTMGAANVRLRHSSVSWLGMEEFWGMVSVGAYEEAAGVAPLWMGATGAVMGPLATYVVVAACCLVCRRGGVCAAAVALGYVSQVRTLARASDLVAGGLRRRAIDGGTDEARIAAITGIPVELLVVVGMVVFGVSGVWLWRYLPRGNRALAGIAMIVGAAGGLVMYLQYIGPWLLP